ncbi:response regulator [Desulfobacula toluolica]|uniref:CheY: chemotaxis protein Y, response regulator n=1 Tax=Desulfobacula toluolica (strain DSM 7467 / Tol2) TaxID=651182 RepID=K0N7N5_DESTT|nr:response regulator [Desulfobacula toluolica]CCK79959.1 CheY: chemotaxis protein Y, response regulator [Desulfobacula toluolica Tol2]
MSYSILIVDDSLPMRSVIKRTFKAAGYVNSEFHEAANGKDALELMKNDWIDIVITDYNMPVMNGMEFIKTIKQDDLLKDIPVVVISTEGNETKIKEFMDCGAAGYITKPFTPETIRDLLTDILGEISYDEDFDDSDDDFDF